MKKPALPATPITSTTMDSDDDFGSVHSSEDFQDQDSEVSEQPGMDEDEEMEGDGFGNSQASGSDNEFDDFDDVDIGFEKIEKLKKQPYEVDFKVYSPEDIQKYQSGVINEVKDVLELTPEHTAILLRYFRWNRERLLDQFVEKREEVLEAAGLGNDLASAPKIKKVKSFSCEICYDDEKKQTFAMKCDHRFCVDCYRQYLVEKIKVDGEAARIQCPGDGCRRIVDAKSIEMLLPNGIKDRYEELLTRTYVDDLENLKWCPAPNCIYAVDCKVKPKELGRIVPTVHCSYGHHFCFGCTLNDHQPAPCAIVKKWLKKCEDDSETANWISANTKECPKCHSTIEKNGGCNHMTCRKCRHEFCWVCMGVWSEHGTSWYNCNRFEERSGSEARDAQAKSRQSLERYLHYYNRYANHEQSAKLDKDIYLRTEKKMTQLQSTANMAWIEVQFLDEASKALQRCRQTLKWTYAFAFYLARNNQTEIFEDNQKDLEMAVENLSEMFEKPVDQLSSLKVEIMDKTTYCNKRQITLLTDTAENLKNGQWDIDYDID